MTKARKQPIKLRFAPYARATEPEWREIDGYVVGDLAVHRPHYLQPDGEMSHLDDRWTVSHLPTGDRVESAMPARFKHLGAIVTRQRELVAWCGAWQAAIPAFFTAAREGDRETQLSLAREALDKGRAL